MAGKYEYTTVQQIQEQYGWTIANIHSFAHDDGWSKMARPNKPTSYRKDHVERTAERLQMVRLLRG